MPSRTPPVSASSECGVHYYVFEKISGTVASTFVGRIIYRTPIRLSLLNGNIVDAVRYNGRYWPTYHSETFDNMCEKWIGEDDTIYTEGYAELELPLKYPYLFDCDKHYSGYD